MSKKVMTTLHLQDSVHGRFKALATAQKRDMSAVAEELISKWIDQHSSGPGPRSERVQMDHAVKLLVKAVCEQLGQHTQWARDTLVGAGLGIPGANVFANRFLHFLDEKQELGKQLASWVLRRSLDHIKNGRRVVLICDSGTTVFWFMKAFGEAVTEYFTESSSGAIGEPHALNSLSILTNNIPGAEVFMTYASLHSVTRENKSVRISDLIDCRILAGSFLPEYAAITGADTERDLDSYAKRMRSNSKAKNKPSSSVFVAITTGNWITMQGKEGSGLPNFFARGRGHGPFKKLLLDICDEAFAITPLGKILIDTTVDEFNKRLKYSESATNPQEKRYELVATPPNKSKVMKVVSTIRTKQSVLRDHSAHLCRKLGQYSTLDSSDAQTMSQAYSPIVDVRHLLLPFDQFSDDAFEAQVEIELPHHKTREESFMRDIFSIRRADVA